MSRKLRTVTLNDVAALQHAYVALGETRDKFRGLGANRAAVYISRAMKSAQGAVRHAQRACLDWPAKAPSHAGEPYTVLLLYPDSIANDYGHETYLAHVMANSPAAAVSEAQSHAAETNGFPDTYPDADERSQVMDSFFPLLVISGHHKDVNPAPGA